jgi:tripartite-type tricarboxylate transporter receptor subunit TctC
MQHRVEGDAGLAATAWRVCRPLMLMASIVGLAAGCQQQKQFPNRPLQMICPWAVGGGTDRVSRQVAALLELELGQPVNVVNATGGAGVTGHSRGARAKPDGYTITMMTVEINMLRHRGLTELSYEDFDPIGLINKDPAALFVRTDAAWKDLAELTEAIRQKPGALSGSGTAKGGIWHLALAGWLKAELLATDAVNWIPSNGSAPSLQELAGGGVDMVCCSLPEAQSLLDAGEIRCVGVMSEDRVQEYPDIPTFREQNVDWVMGGWRGIGLPHSVPPEIRQTLADAVDKVAHSERFLEFMKQAGFDARWEDSPQFARSLEETDATLGGLLREQFQELREEQFGPMFFPKLTGVGFVLVSLGMAVQSYVRHRRRRQMHTPDEELAYTISAKRLGELGFVLLAIAAFIVLIEPLGFMFTAGLFLGALLIATRTRRPVVLICVFVFVPLLYELFANQFRVPLPVGELLFR